MSDIFQPDILEKAKNKILVSEEAPLSIVLYNDDFNTFEFVIETLINVCDHDELQAQQCTYLIHFKGKCAVKIGTYEKLKPICETLLNKGLSAQIED